MLHVLAIAQPSLIIQSSIEKNQFSIECFYFRPPCTGLRFLETMCTCAGPIIVFDKTVPDAERFAAQPTQSTAKLFILF